MIYAILFILQPSVAPPPPDRLDAGPPGPPVGDQVPIDGDLWILAAVAIVIAAYYFLRLTKAKQLSA